MSTAPPLTQAERAAVIVMLLGEEEAAAVLSRLDPEELRLVGETMCRLGDIGSGPVAQALEGFIQHAAEDNLSAHDRPARVRTLMTGAVGEAKASHLMQQIVPARANRSLEIARWLAPDSLLALLDGEHPQAIAVLLLLLDADQAAALLAKLPPHVQPNVVERIARLGKVSTQAVTMLDQVLSRRIEDRFGQDPLTMGGAREAAELINKAAGAVERVVMPAIEQRDAELARAIVAEMFTFAMLLELDPQSMGRLLREVESDVLIDALKGLDDGARDTVFAAMSSRAADGVKDEIELRGRIRKTDVEAAQKSMIETARKLADAGEISFGSGDGEYV